MTALIVSGAGGRLGRRILDVAPRPVVALVRPGSAHEGAELAPGVRGTSDEGLIQAGGVLVECAPRAQALLHAERAAAGGVPILVATTGFDAGERARLEAHAARVPVLIAPNLSLGIAVLTELVERASRALPGFALEVLEIHHDRKKDAPSGTAWALGRAGAAARDLDIDRAAIVARSGEVGARSPNEVGLQSLRGGDVVGEHTVYLFGRGERLELTHRATDRGIFAEGAVRAAAFLASQGRAPGLYTMRDVVLGA